MAKRGKHTVKKRKAPFKRRVRPRIVLSLAGELRPIVELARKWDWELLDLEVVDGVLPDAPPPSGALIGELVDGPLAQQLLTMGCPVVRLGQFPHPRDDVLPAVVQDQAAAGRLAAEHFAQRRFKEIAFLGSDVLHPGAVYQALYLAFRDRAGELGLTCHLHNYAGATRPDEGPAKRYAVKLSDIGEWLAGLPKPVGVFTFNDRMAIQVCMVGLEAGLGVPEDVAVLGLGNHTRCEMSPVALSSIAVAQEEAALTAMRLLRRLMRGEPAPKATVMVPPGGVVVRRSTDVLAVADPVVSRALRFMWDHFDQNLGVDDIAAEVGVSRRGLERAFGRHLGRSVMMELRRKRLQEVCRLLRTTDDAVAVVAAKAGFRSAEYFHACFREAYHTTPRKFRQANAGLSMPETDAS